MTREEVWAELTRVEALTNDSNGGPHEYHKRVVYLHARTMFRLSDAIANEFMYDHIEVVIAASERNVVLAQWIAYFLTNVSSGRNVYGIYAERSMRAGTLAWCIWKWFRGRASFAYEDIVRGKKVLLVEEVLDADGSSQKVVEVVRYLGAHVIGLGAICNCSEEVARSIDVPKIAALVSVA